MSPTVDITALAQEQSVTLYHAARELPPERFQEFALHTLRETHRFACGVWGTGWLADDGSVRIVDAHRHNMAPDALARWQSLSHEDLTIRRAMARAGEVVVMHGPVQDAAVPGGALAAHAVRNGWHHALTAVCVQRGRPLVEWIALYRDDTQGRWSDDDAALLRAVAPHLREALVVNRVLQSWSTDADGATGMRWTAVADLSGHLLHTAAGGLEMLAREWHEAQNRHLPADVLRAIMEGGIRHFCGRAISCEARTGAGLIALRFRPRCAADSLTPRRLHIAGLFANGRNYKEIAREANIAPATVRNHLRAIYEALGIRSRGELVSLLRGGTTHPA